MTDNVDYVHFIARLEFEANSHLSQCDPVKPLMKQVAAHLTNLLAERNALRDALSTLKPEGEQISGELLRKAEEQVEYWKKKQNEYPCPEDFRDDDGNQLPVDYEGLFNFYSANGRYSEADWWLSTIKSFHSSEQISVEAVERFQREYVAISYECKWVDAGSFPDDETSRRLLNAAIGGKT